VPDGHAACIQAELAIKQVFHEPNDTSDWFGWHLIIRNKDDEEVATLSVTDTLGGMRPRVAELVSIMEATRPGDRHGQQKAPSAKAIRG
jgi:hypothetical protein